MQVYLCLKNPLDMRNLPLIPTEKQFIAFLNKIGLTNYKSQSKLNVPIPIFQFFDEYGESLRYDLQSLGYDGIIFEDISALGTTYIAFYPNQIKSATGNDGTWDADDDSILSGSEEEITYDNFHLSTFANFTKLPLSQIPKSKPDFISDSGSKYWYKNDSVYRYSTHFFRNVASCKWFLNNEGHKKLRGFGVCKLSDFKRINYTLNPGKIYKIYYAPKNRMGKETITTFVAKFLYSTNDFYVFENKKISKLSFCTSEAIDSILSGSKEPDIILNYFKYENEDFIKSEFEKFVEKSLDEKDFICNLFVINGEKRFSFSANYIRHAYKSHKQPHIEDKKNQIAITVNDLKRIVEIVFDGNYEENYSIERNSSIFTKRINGYICVVEIKVRHEEYQFRTMYIKRGKPSFNRLNDNSLSFTPKNVFYNSAFVNNDDTKQNLLQDSLIDNKKRFYDIYEKANGKYADYFLIVENLLGLELHYHYGDIVQVYQHNTTYHYVYLGFRKNPYNNSLKYYDHNVLSHSNSNTSTFSEEELTLAKKRNQVEELAKISYDEVNELIDKGYLENSWYYRDGGTYKYHYKGKEYVTEKEPVLIFRIHWDYDAKGGGIIIKQSGINKIKKIRKRIKTDGKNSKKCV